MTILAEATVVVKPVVTLPFAWGFQDGATGVSWAEGYGLFAGERLSQYLAGHTAGKQAATRKAMSTAQVAPSVWDDGRGGPGYIQPSEMDAPRTRRIIDQVRFAQTRHERQEALDAACRYSPTVYASLAGSYAVWRMPA